MAITPDFLIKTGLVVTNNSTVKGDSLVEGQLSVSGDAAINGDATINDITVGTGGVATNTVVGENALASNVSGTNNVAIGRNAGQALTGSSNVILGNFNGNQNGLDLRFSDNHVVIADGQGAIRLFVDDQGRVGINTTTPQSELDVNGTITTTSLSSTTLTVSGNSSVSGNFQVDGELTVLGRAIIEGDIEFEDRILLLNAEFPATSQPTEDAGFEVNRGAQNNVSFYWDESEDQWTTGSDPTFTTQPAKLEAVIDCGFYYP